MILKYFRKIGILYIVRKSNSQSRILSVNLGKEFVENLWLRSCSAAQINQPYMCVVWLTYNQRDQEYKSNQN
jgi:hypothetical protein